VLVDLGAVPAGQTSTTLLAQDPAPPPGKGEEFGKASPVGLVVLVVLFLATILLVRSMNKHLRKVPASFDEAREPDEAVAIPTDTPAARPPDGAAVSTPNARSTDDTPDGAARG
jgi:hypothetical protein